MAANPAIFTPDDIRATAPPGAPWYTSGAHWWNGAAETLNPRPTIMSAMPASMIPGSASKCPIPTSRPSTVTCSGVLMENVPYSDVDPNAANVSATP